MPPKGARCVWLFGSEARGSADTGSDIDVLLVGEEICIEETTEWVASKRGTSEPDRIDVSAYTPDGMLALVKQGSLFAWHLKTEGVALWDRSNWLGELLLDLRPYDRYLEDLGTLMNITADVFESTGTNNPCGIFDGGLLGTTIRNTSIIVLNYLGESDYSPWAPILLGKLCPWLAPAVSEHEYRNLVQCRRMGERGAGGEVQRTASSMRRMAGETMAWQRRCVEYIERGRA